MTAIERTAYPRFKTTLSQEELDTIYCPNTEEIEAANKRGRGPTQRLVAVLLLKSFQRLGYFPPLHKIPPQIVFHISKQLSVPKPAPSKLTVSDASLYKYHQEIRDQFGVFPYRDGGSAVAAAAIALASETMSDPADLINAAVEELIRNHFELPAFSALDRLTGRIRTEINEGWYQMVMERLNPEQQLILDSLPRLSDESSHTNFTTLKRASGKARLSQFRAWQARIIWLESLLNTVDALEGIPKKRILLFAAEARALEAADITRFSTARRYTLLVSLLHQAKIRTRDELIAMFIKRISLIHKNAQAELDEIRERQREMTEYLIDVLSGIVQQASEITDSRKFGERVYQVFEKEGGVQKLSETCASVSAYHGNNYYPLMSRYYKTHRSVLFQLISVLDIQSATQEKTLIQALEYLRENQRRTIKFLPAEISLDFASKRWQRLIKHEQDDEPFHDRRRLEICIFSRLAMELKTGDLFVMGSDEYADFREQLLSWQDCQPLLKPYCQTHTFAENPGQFIQQLKEWLTKAAKETDENFLDSGQLYFSDNRPVLRRLRKRQAPDGAGELRQVLSDVMPERNLLDVLANVEHWVHYTRHFGPLSGSDTKIENPTLRYVMTIFGFGTNLGPVQCARHSRGTVSARVLSLANHQHITTEKLDAALKDIINYYNRFDLPRFWGSGKRATADGTLYDIYQNNLLSERHVRYGGYGGIAYHHVSDKYIALFSHFISVGVWEAVYIIDGLLKNKSDIQPDTLHADTQGQSLTVFGFAHLLGIKLMPRIRNWQDLILFRPSRNARYEHIDSLFSGVIDWNLLETHWQDLMQVILSIHAGKVLPSMLLRKLGNYSRKNRLFRAFRELGRIVRTVFLLQYITDESGRRLITATTNKVESYHAFSGWSFFGGHGTIAVNDPVEQEKRIKYNDLVANALILQNVVDMTEKLKELKELGYMVNPETVATLSPYLTEHIRRFGDYILDLENTPGQLDFGFQLNSNKEG